MKTSYYYFKETEKSLCKDLRDCQVYFPCSFFITGFGDQELIEQCKNDLVFDENKQECVQPHSQADLDCLFSKYSTIFSDGLEIEPKRNESSVTKLIKTTQQKTKSTEQINLTTPKSKFTGKILKTEIKPILVKNIFTTINT